MHGPEAALTITSLSAGYSDRPVLHDVSVEVAQAEVVGLVGPNGAGKTTLVRAASRGLPLRSGTVRVFGVDPYAIPARRAARLVAVVPQDLAPAFPFSALEIVLMGRSPYRSPWAGGGAEDWARAREAMARTSVQHLADRPLDELSAGERQRVVLAQALAQDAPLLLLDEPTTHLDLRHVVEILGLVRDLARSEGKGVLAVFHDLNLAGAYCDRIYALSEGRMVAEGPPEDVIDRDLLRLVFEVEGEVFPSPATGLPVVAPGAPIPTRLPGSRRVHLIGGAGRGARVLRALAERGFEVTAGVLHASDTDAEVAERLNLLRVTVPAFSPIDDRSAMDCLELIRQAAVLVVCDPPFGPGNVANLRLALAAAGKGTAVALLGSQPIEERDFTGGEATDLWRQLQAVAQIVRTEEELLVVCEAYV